MKVRAVKSFVATLPDGTKFRITPESEPFTLPKGVDWLQAGLVVPVGAPERAVRPAGEKAVRVGQPARRGKKKS